MIKENLPSTSLDFWEIIMICLNGAIGISIYSVPWAFSQVGWCSALLISIFSLLFLTFLGLTFLQAISRMNIIDKCSSQGYTFNYIPFLELFQNHPPSHYIKFSNEASDNFPLIEEHLDSLELKLSYDVTTICKTLLGKFLEKFMNIGIIFSTIVLLIGYASIFASSMASVVNLGVLQNCDIEEDPSFQDSCRYKYIFFLGVLGVVAVLTSFVFHLTEQKWYLISVCIARLVAIFLMGFTALVCTINQSQLDDEGSADVQPDYYNPRGFPVAMPLIILTMAFHVILPNLIFPLEDKKKSPNAIITTLVIGWLLVVFLGLTCVFSISDPSQLGTLDWKDYSNGKKSSDRKWWTYIVDVYISVFPAIDVTSMFSIYIQNLADNICALKYENIKEYQVEEKLVNMWKVIILAVSISFPIYFYDVGLILAASSILNLLCLMFFISMFGLASLILIPEKCVFDNCLTKKWVLRASVVFSACFIVLSMVTFIIYCI